MWKQLSAEFVAYTIVFLLFLIISILLRYIKKKDIFKKIYKTFKKISIKKWLLIIIVFFIIMTTTYFYDIYEKNNDLKKICNKRKYNLKYSPEKNSYFQIPINAKYNIDYLLGEVGDKDEIWKRYKSTSVFWYKDREDSFNECMNFKKN